MTNFQINFEYPWLLLLLIPAIALTLLPYLRMQKRYRRTRNRVISVVLHMVVMVLCVTLVSGITFSYDLPNTENELLIVVDSSFSGRDRADDRDKFIEEVINDCGSNYRVGVVKFGYDQLYAAELSNDSAKVYREYLASDEPDTSATDIAAALTYASGLLSRPESAKIVLLSDGIETDGNAFSVIRGIAANGTKVDVVPLLGDEFDEVQIVGAETPDRNVVVGETVNIRLILQSNVGGKDNDVSITLSDNGVPDPAIVRELTKGLQAINIPHTFDKEGLHELSFALSVKNADGDTVEQNNSYFSYMYMNVFNRVLVVEKDLGESEPLCELLESEEFGMEVTVMNAAADVDKLPKSVEEFCEYDQVVLVNIANKDMKPEFFEMLNVYVNDLGGGMFTVGGNPDKNENGEIVPHAYLRRDMQGTLYQQMLPVRVIDYTPPVAVMIVVDTSGSMSSAVPQAKRGAHAVLDALTSRDYCGVMTFSEDASEEVQVLPVSQKIKIQEAINAIPDDGSGGTVFTNAISKAGSALAAADVARRHMIMVTDGVVDDEDVKLYTKLIEENRKKGITLSIVGVGCYGNYKTLMDEACKLGGGTFYDASVLGSSISDAIQKDFEDNIVSEIKYGEEFTLRINEITSAVTGITQPELDKLPFKGYYGTTLRNGAVAPLVGEFVPIYAQWKYGNGTVGSFMSNLTDEWAGDFLQSDTGKRFIKNVLSGLFPTQEINLSDIELTFKNYNYTTDMNVYTPLEETDTVSVTVTPKSKEAIEFYSRQPVRVTASDGYTRFGIEITCPGLYEITVQKKNAAGEVLSERVVNRTFSYSAEYNAFPEDSPIGLEYLEALATSGRGEIVTDSLSVFETFEKSVHRTADPRIVMLIIAIVLFVLDVAVRKFKFKWIHELVRDRKAKQEMEARGGDGE